MPVMLSYRHNVLYRAESSEQIVSPPLLHSSCCRLGVGDRSRRGCALSKGSNYEQLGYWLGTQKKLKQDGEREETVKDEQHS